jgi:hypothetical protein
MRRKLLQCDGAMPEIAKRALKVYVPDLVLQGTVTGVSGALAEIRSLTCVFIDINLDLTDTSIGAISTLEVLQGVFQCIHLFAVLEYGGFIKELTCDDKGLVCVLGFGFIQPAHAMSEPEEEPRSSAASACLAAVNIERELQSKHKVSCYIGIASGMVYCAALGNEWRRELAMVSAAMNTAARLMGVVRKGTLVDMDGCASEAAAAATDMLRARGASERNVRRGSLSRMASTEQLGAPVFSKHVLCTEEVRKDAATCQGLFFHKLSKVPLKGYDEPIAPIMIGAPEISAQDSQVNLVRSVTLVLASGQQDSDDSPVRQDTSSTSEFVAQEVQDAEAWRAAHTMQTAALSYAQYYTMLPAFFGARKVQSEASDYIWIRSSGGDPMRIAALVRSYTAGSLGKINEEADEWCLLREEFIPLLDVGSKVPPEVSQHLLRGVST